MIGSTMGDFPLTVNAILRHGRGVHGASECVTSTGDGMRRATYAEIADNADRLAAALRRLGVRADDRVATFMWNDQEHLEAYFAIPCMGAVLHTLNIRLFPEQLVYVANHARDRIVIIDTTLVPVIGPVASELTTVEAWIVVGDGDATALEATGRPVHRYHELLAREQPGFDYPEPEERAAAAMCYTSGTTGEPKGVAYSHRSTYLHSLAVCTPAVLGLDVGDRVLTIVPQFHANAWGMPYAAFLSGASLLMPSRFLQAEPLARFIAAARPTLSAAVPTIWAELYRYGEDHELDVSSLRIVVCGGAALPRSLMERFERRNGLRLIQGWGMTEMSPLGSVAHPPADAPAGSEAEMDWRAKTGRVARVGRLRRRRNRGTRPVDNDVVLGRPRAREVPRRLAAHRRRRNRHTERLHADHRPGQGCHQVGRRVDQLGRARERDHGAPARRGGRGDRHPRPAMGRTTARVRGGFGRSRRRRVEGVPRGNVREVAAARQLGVRGDDPEDIGRQVRQEGPARVPREGRPRGRARLNQDRGDE
jgi:acyl-CoA synthetase (AMP-forming)/AMP-acid ligase II